MKKIVLISCAAKKRKGRAKAEYLYISPLFTSSLKYAKSLRPDKIYILSAKYGLVELDREIGPYNVTLNEMEAREVRNWAEKVIEQLKRKVDLQKDHFILLAGETYRKYLIAHMKSYEVPMKGMRIGEQLRFLSNKTHE